MWLLRVELRAVHEYEADEQVLRRDGPDLACQLTAADGLDLVRVDFGQHGDFSRSKKDSFYWYKKVCESNGEEI